MNDSDSILTVCELQALHSKFRDIKHDVNNTFAVIMALSELGQRNPAHFEKLAKAVLERCPKVVDQLSDFSDMLGAPLKGTHPASGFTGALPPVVQPGHSADCC